MCSPSLTLLPPPSPYHPSGSSQCTSPKHPVSCIEPGLATRFIYDIIHVSMPLSQIIPPSPSPTESWSHRRILFFFPSGYVGSLFPNQGSNQHPLHWKPGVLTTGPSGKFLSYRSILIITATKCCVLATDQASDKGFRAASSEQPKEPHFTDEETEAQ